MYMRIPKVENPFFTPTACVLLVGRRNGVGGGEEKVRISRRVKGDNVTPL